MGLRFGGRCAARGRSRSIRPPDLLVGDELRQLFRLPKVERLALWPYHPRATARCAHPAAVQPVLNLGDDVVQGEHGIVLVNAVGEGLVGLRRRMGEIRPKVELSPGPHVQGDGGVVAAAT